MAFSTIYKALPACTLAAVLLIAPAVHAQDRITDKELELNKKNLSKDSLLLESDADFHTSNTTTKWNEESAVILCSKTSFSFDKKGLSVGKRIGRNIWGVIFAPVTFGASIYMANMNDPTHILVEETERRKILLKDKYGLEKYSLLYFRQTTDGDAFAARVIKKDGTEIPVDLEDAVRIEDVRNVPSTFKSYTEPAISSTYRPTYFKIAVPDLEEGDIIEYEYRHYNPQNFLNNPQYEEFEPVYYLCNRSLPVSRQIIEVTTEDDNYFVTYKSLKGAPSFSETTTSKGNKVYRWVDDDRDKLQNARYVDEYREYPSVKFQVVYARNRSHDLVWFKSPEDMKNDITVADLTDKAKAFWFATGKVQNTGDYAAGLSMSIPEVIEVIYKAMKKRGTVDQPDDQFVQKAYYSVRAHMLYNTWSDYAFAKVFSGLLARKKIDHDIVVSTYNSMCDLDKVAFTQDLAWVVKYKNKYYINPKEHGNPEDLQTYLIGNTALSFNYRQMKGEPSRSQSEVLPLTDTADNMLYTKVNVLLDPNGVDRLTVDKTVQAKGLVKDELSEDILALTPFMETDFRNYDGAGMFESLNENVADKAMGDFAQAKKEWKEDKPKMMKEEAEDEYNATVEKYNDFKIVDDGRSYKHRILKYTESFQLNGLTATAGDDILIALPSLIGNQPKIKKDERVRTLPINVGYPRTLLYTITFTIPEGYTVKGLTNITHTVNNDCGSFTTMAKVDGNILEIDVRKLYKLRNMSANQWPELCAILDAGYAFSQAKIVLQKNP